MRFFRLVVLTIFFSLLFSPTMSFADDNEAGLWLSDFAAAKVAASEQGKDILIDFTGSNWCGWCIRLHQEVFSQDAFKSDAPNDFILMKVDFIRETQNPESKALVAAWQEDGGQERLDEMTALYPVSGYPTVYLVNADGRAYAKTGYQDFKAHEGGAAAGYLEQLLEYKTIGREIDKALKAAAKKKRHPRARLLAEALRLAAENGFELSDASGPYAGEVREVVELDTENKLGLRQEFGLHVALMQINELLSDEETEPVAIVDHIDFMVDNFSEEAPTELLLNLLVNFKAPRVLALEDLAAAREVIADAYSLIDQKIGTGEGTEVARQELRLGVHRGQVDKLSDAEGALENAKATAALAPDSKYGKMINDEDIPQIEGMISTDK